MFGVVDEILLGGEKRGEKGLTGNLRLRLTAEGKAAVA